MCGWKLRGWGGGGEAGVTKVLGTCLYPSVLAEV